MQHYTKFLPKRTLRTVQLGKMSKALDFDIEETERKLNRLQNEKQNLENEIFNSVDFHHGFNTPEIINTAKEKAHDYNYNRVMIKGII